ncbi:response regulator transcription factor [Spongiactinospora sp. TRM90649]|uniref:LuxR C-terminal-related transcriptional regulator n=1 Tax=Spongiactinospora sp. TRM90649 TaxID=3031114 RepID=UPI0023F79D4A|nr:response regulator transcription factor [Spongiactinospora sp. TRM90649]MDF5752454.1 response regulator transcription factor [Spongiactinospora sp. TRM90649]
MTKLSTKVMPPREWRPVTVYKGHTRDCIKILVVDEHKLMREVLCEVLHAEDDFCVLDDSSDPKSIVELVARVRPDIVLFDIDKPHSGPMDIVRRVREVSPETIVAVLSMYDDIEQIRAMLRVGVRCYLHKGISRHDLVAALRGVIEADGRVTLAVSPESFVNEEGRLSGPLSEREQEVLALVAEAMSNRQIATRLSVTEGTVKRHLRNIFNKLGAVSRIDAVNKYKAIANATGGGYRRELIPRVPGG